MHNRKKYRHEKGHRRGRTFNQQFQQIREKIISVRTKQKKIVTKKSRGKKLIEAWRRLHKNPTTCVEYIYLFHFLKIQKAPATYLKINCGKHSRPINTERQILASKTAVPEYSFNLKTGCEARVTAVIRLYRRRA